VEAMFVIRQEQIQILRETLFRSQLEDHLSASCGALVSHLTAAEFQCRLDYALGIARGYGFDAPDSQQAALVTLLFHTGPLFHRHPAMRAVLDERSCPPGERIARLFSETSAWAWAAVTDPGDEAWQRALGEGGG